ncbi:RHS repeat-associated core domain-containing protein [Acinetobacter haemolyticus]|uniref:RHS repeat-associated core domain-containing protein n=1 Tax=Acinetobacter haemolyticus TaxID=29430 RepID=UPI0034D782D3
MEKISNKIKYSFWLCLWGLVSLISQLTYATPDIVSQNYASARSPGIQSCTVGYDLMAGDVSYGQSQIVGALPYNINYRAPLRQNLSAAQSFAQPESSSTGWSDNYQAHVFIQNTTARTTEYTQYYTQQVSSNPLRYQLTTISPTTYTSLSAKTIWVRLPGESTDTIFKEQNGNFTRLYSADAVRDLNNNSLQSLPWNSDLGEYQLSRSGNNLIIVKNGVKYTISDSSHMIAPAQTYTSSVNLYIDSYGYFRTTTNSWGVYWAPSYAISNTDLYLKTDTTVSLALHRVTQIDNQQGQVIDLQYDSNMNLTQVSDKYNNKLVFERTFHDASTGSSQTIDESRLVTKVTYTAAQGGSQVATFNYQAYANKIPSTGQDTTVFALISSSSTATGSYSYFNEMTEIGAIKAYVASKGRTADASYYYPVLRQVKNSVDQVVRQWDITQNYVLGSGTSYTTAQTTLRSYTPLSSGTSQDYSTVYDDIARTINLTLALSTSTATSSVQSTVNSNKSLTVTQTGYSCLTSNGIPISSAEFATDRSRLVKVTDAKNVASTYQYDNLNRVTEIKEAVDTALSRSTTYTYGPLNNNAVNLFTVPTNITTPLLTIDNVLNARGQIVKQTENSNQSGSVSKTTTYIYNETPTNIHFGRLLSVDGPRAGTADKISYTYHAYGALASQYQIINGAERRTWYSGYNHFGQPQRIVYPTGLVDFMVYNPDGTLKSKTTGVGGTTGTITGQTTTYSYNSLKQKISETSPDGETIQFTYDVAGRLGLKTLANGTKEQYSYYPIGILSRIDQLDVSGALIISQHQLIDSNGRINKTYQGTNSSFDYILYSYDANGNLIQTTRPYSLIEKWSYDALNRIKTHTDGEGKVDIKDYDVGDNLVLAKDPLNAGTNPYRYRNGSVLTQEVNSDYGTKTYSYNEADQLTQRLHGSRQCDYNNLDEIGRYGAYVCGATSGTTANEYQVNETYLYDQSRYGRLDKVTGLSNYDVDTTYQYDAYNRVTQKGTINHLANRHLGNGRSLNVNYNYSLAGKLTSMTLPSGRNISYQYNTAGQLSGIQLDGSSLIRNITYDGANRLSQWNWGTGNANIKFSYHANYGVLSSIYSRNNSNAVNYYISYGYDSAGRIIALNRNTGVRDTFSYDKVDRLVNEARTTGGVETYQIQYGYDANGNRTSLGAVGQHLQSASNVNYSYTGNRLTGLVKDGVNQSLAYTANGDLRYGNYLPTYDNGGRKKVDRSSSDYYYMNYTYKNERSLRTQPTFGTLATTTQFIYDEQSHLVGEYPSSVGEMVEYVWMGDKPVAAIYGSGANTKIYYIVADGQNTPRRLIDSSTHQVAWAWDSTAFGLGDPVGTVTFNLRFPGQYYDQGTGQFYNHNRYYNPELGRYMEPDPIGLEGGLNPYAYVGSNPVMFTDSTGLVLDMLNNAGLSNVWMNNFDNQMWMNQQQRMFENWSVGGNRVSYNGTGTKDYITYDASLSALSARDTTQFVKYHRSTFFPNSAQVQHRAETFQTIGTSLDVFAWGCATSVICSPIAPVAATGGAIIGGVGTLMDQESTVGQKLIGLIMPSVAGSAATKYANKVPYMNSHVSDGFGLFVDKTTGATIDGTFECIKNKWDKPGC